MEDTTRVMLRLKALFRARGIATRGTAVYHADHREGGLTQLTNRGARFRAEALYPELDVLRALRPCAKAAMVQEARQDPAWPVLQSIPFVGPGTLHEQSPGPGPSRAGGSASPWIAAAYLGNSTASIT